MRKWSGLAALAAAMVLSQAARAADNRLTREEQSAGWKLLFDGRTYAGWRDPTRLHPPGDSFVIEDGCLKAVANPRIREDLMTAATFRDFELVFDWRIAPGANTGLKYLIQRLVFLDHDKPAPGIHSFEESVGYEMEHHLADRALKHRLTHCRSSWKTGSVSFPSTHSFICSGVQMSNSSPICV